ncbi:MAG: putative sulfate/molybdate transporter [Candidatus Rokubacteria bacterium]|nr:putative sulfate/molybdate transporter [Candidatus Rokubacteria bacterium]
MRIAGNEYSLRETAGAFGDLGTLIPFLAGYVIVAQVDPTGVLVAFGLFKIVTGLVSRTPVPIQPMKAIGTAVIASGGVLTPAAIWASGFFTGAVWLAMGLTGAVGWVAKMTSRPVIQGLVLGLGLGFLLQGISDRPITVRGVAIDHGVMNVIGTTIGGVPMCHGAGGMAGHVRFGARTGGSSSSSARWCS